MPDLDADIARIAALRGRPAQAYVEAAADLEVQRTHIGRQRAVAAFNGDGDGRGDLRHYDALPARSRAFLRDAPTWISAKHWLDMLDTTDGDERKVISLFEAVIPEHIDQRLRRAYGAKHPSVKGNR